MQNSKFTLHQQQKLKENKVLREQQRITVAKRDVLEQVEERIGNHPTTRRVDDDPMIQSVIDIAAKNKVQDARKSIIDTWDIRNKHKKQKEDIIEQMYIDALTGIKNRGAFDKELSLRNDSLEVEDKRSIDKKGAKSWLVLVDLDYFKEVNDTQGHDEGDKVLKEVTHKISKRLRDKDFFARIGGDEFAIIIDNATQQDVINLSEVLRERIQETDIGVTLSIGVSPFFSDNTEEAHKKADEALYASKGNDQVISADQIQGGLPKDPRNNTYVYDPQAGMFIPGKMNLT